MAIISIRLNKKEENMVNFLSDYYEQDKSSLIKHSLKELYEDIIDRQIITEYELKEKKGNAKFVNADEIIQLLKSQRNNS